MLSIADATAMPDRGRWGEAVWSSAGAPMMVVTRADGRRVTAMQLAEQGLAYWRTVLGPGRMAELPDETPWNASPGGTLSGSLTPGPGRMIDGR